MVGGALFECRDLESLSGGTDNADVSAPDVPDHAVSGYAYGF